MRTHKIIRTGRITMIRRSSAGRATILAATLAGAAWAGAMPANAAAQSALGVPFIGNNHLSFYATELTTDGVGTSTSTLYGGRYAHRFGSAMARSSISLMVQGAARQLDAPMDGVADLSVAVGWSRRVDELTPHLSVAVSAGASVLAWGTIAETDNGLARFSVPVTAGVGYDLRVGGVTFSPFVAQSYAYTHDRAYENDVLVGRDSGWDSRRATGVSVSLKEVVLTGGHIRGEHGLPNRSRWTMAAGVSF